MTLYRSNPATSLAPPATDGPISLGVEFKVTDANCTLNGFRFYQAAAPWVGTVTAALYAVGGTTQLTAPITVTTATIFPVSASSEPAGGGFQAAQAFDGNTSTRWLGTVPTTGTPQWLRAVPGSSQVATGYTITPHPSSQTYSPTAWKFQGSNDGTSWTDLDTRSGVAWPSNAQQTFTFSNSTGYLQYRLLMTAVNGATDFVAITELAITGVTIDYSQMWREATLSTPYPLTVGTNYRAVLLFSSNRPSANGGAATTLVNGPLTVPSSGSSVGGNNNYVTGAAMANPTGSVGSNYMIDVIVGQAGTGTPQALTGLGMSVAAAAGMGSFTVGTKVRQSFTGTAAGVTASAPVGIFTAGNVRIPQTFIGSGVSFTRTASAGSFIAPSSGGQSFTGQGVTVARSTGVGSFTAAGTLPSVIEKVRYHGPITGSTTLAFTAPHQAGDVVVIALLARANSLPTATASGLGGTWTVQNGSIDPYGTNRVFVSTNRTSAGTVTITGSAYDMVLLGYVIRGAQPVVTVLPDPANPTADEHGRGQVVIVTALQTATGKAGDGLDLPALESLPSPSAWTPDSPYTALTDNSYAGTWAAGAAVAIPTETAGYYADTNNFGNGAQFVQTRIVVGTYVNAQRVTGSGVAEHTSAPAGSFEALTTYSIGGTLTTGDVQLPRIIVMAATTLTGGGALTASETMPVVAIGNTVLRGGGTLVTRSGSIATPDPRRLAPQWRYVVTDLANMPVGELVDIEHDAVEDGVGEATTMSFTIATDSDQYALIKPIERQCQVWEGDVLRLRGPILPGSPSDDGTTITHKIHDPSWFWRDGRRVITRTPQKNLLHNGDFKNDLAWWRRGFDKDSIPAAAPSVRVVSEDFVDDTDGLDPIKAAEIVGVESVTEAELSSNAVFWPNLASFRPGGVASVEAVANAMPTTAGLKVTVVGHTANDGTGNGLGLSLRRAQAAAAVIKKKRPGVVITTKGVGFYDPNPKFPKDSQAQRRVVIQYEQTISGKSKQFMVQTVEVTQPKEARYPLVLTVAAMLKVADDWSVPDANMVSLKIVARRKGAAKPLLPWDDQLGVGSSSISDTDPVDRWIPQTAEATIPADGRVYEVDVYLYAPAALARYTAVGLFPDEQLYFWGQDQATIFKGVMEHIQKPEFGYADLGVATRAPLTGVKRDREFAFRDLTPADTALDGLMGISRGIEWDTVTTPTVTTATSFYPRQGQSVDYMLVQGGNVASAVPANTRDIGSAIIAQAQGLGSYRAVAYANDARIFGGTLIQRVITAEQDTPLNELRETAKAELFWARSSTPAYWVDIDPDSIAEVLANTAKGDTVRLILDYPTAVDRLARIVRRQIHPDSLRLMVAFEEV